MVVIWSLSVYYHWCHSCASFEFEMKFFLFKSKSGPKSTKIDCSANSTATWWTWHIKMCCIVKIHCEWFLCRCIFSVCFSWFFAWVGVKIWPSFGLAGKRFELWTTVAQCVCNCPMRTASKADIVWNVLIMEKSSVTSSNGSSVCADDWWLCSNQPQRHTLTQSSSERQKIWLNKSPINIGHCEKLIGWLHIFVFFLFISLHYYRIT